MFQSYEQSSETVKMSPLTLQVLQSMCNIFNFLTITLLELSICI